MIKVYLVEDEVILLNSLKQKIIDLDMDFSVVGTATNANDAITDIENILPDIVLTDIRMPGMDGLELVAILKEKHPSIVFAIISGYSEFEYTKKAIKLKVEDFLLKPITISDLRKCLISCSEKINSYTRSQEAAHPMMLSSHSTQLTNSLKNSDYYIGYVVYHSALRNIDVVVHPAVSFTSIASFRDVLSKHVSFDFYCFNGLVSNEKIVIIKAANTDFDELYCQLNQANMSLSKKYNTTIYLSKCYNRLDLISDYISYARKCAASQLILGQSIIRSSNDNTLDVVYTPIITSKVLEEGLSYIKHNKFDLLNEQIINMFHKWEQDAYPLYFVEKELLFFVEYIGRNVPSQEGFDFDFALYLEDIIVTSDDYSSLCCNYCNMLIELFGNAETKEDVHLSNIEIVEFVKEYFASHISSYASLKELCALLDLSQTYLCKIFKAEENCTPMNYYTKIKIEKAKELIVSSDDIKLKDISVMTGFSDPYYFSKVFKKVEGISPSQFAQKVEHLTDN